MKFFYYLVGLIYLLNAQEVTTFEGGSTTGSPPAPMAYSGPNHFVELINNQYSVYELNGDLLKRTTADQFWTNSGVSIKAWTFDQKIYYDQISEKWYALSADNPGGKNSYLFAISKTTNPLDGWNGIRIPNPDPTNYWVDFPTLGISGNTINISCKLIPFKYGGDYFSNVILNKTNLSIIKSTLLTGSVIKIYNPFQQINTEENRSIFVSNSQMIKSDGFFKLVEYVNGLWTIKGFTIQQFGKVSQPGLAMQPEGAAGIDTLDFRILCYLREVNGIVWGIHTIDHHTDYDNDLQWFAFTKEAKLISNGIIDEPNYGIYFPSIAVNEFGEVVISANASGLNRYLSAVIYTGNVDANTNIVNLKQYTLAEGKASYNITWNNRNRWGDQSVTWVDANNPHIFWSHNAYVHEKDKWKMINGRICFPPKPPTGLRISLDR